MAPSVDTAPPRHDNVPNDPAALIYTHPGWPAYMGLNHHGLSVLWQYIDTGERNAGGVPTNILIREMLAQETLDQALDLLHRSPRMVPNNFILTDSSRTVNVEASPSRFTVLSVEGRGLTGPPLSFGAYEPPSSFVVHTNHVLFDQAMQDADIGIKHANTTVARYEAMRRMVRDKCAAGAAGAGRPNAGAGGGGGGQSSCPSADDLER